MRDKPSFIGAMLAAASTVFLLECSASAQTVQPSEKAFVRSTNAGEVEGQVLSVDYQKSTMSLQTKSRGRLDIVILPSTNIVNKTNGFLTIADIKRGSHVHVFLSKHADTLNAQIIRLE